MVAPLDIPLWSCPECRMRGVLEGSARLGNRRQLCGTCNRWARAVQQKTAVRMAQRHPAEYARARAEVEADLYARVAQEWRLDHPGPAPAPTPAMAR